QTLTVALLSNPGQPLFNRETINSDFVSRLESELKNLQCSNRGLDLAAGLATVRTQLTEQPCTSRNLHVVSDYRKADWEDDSALGSLLQGLAEDGVSVNLVKTVPEWHGNLGLTALTGAIDVAAANVPLRLTATVRNHGEQAARDVRLAVLVDGKRVPFS
ncbi:MAG: hypothetical protein ACKOFW_07800, partial [Planctomycetaceae bacterium]